MSRNQRFTLCVNYIIVCASFCGFRAGSALEGCCDTEASVVAVPPSARFASTQGLPQFASVRRGSPRFAKDWLWFASACLGLLWFASVRLGSPRFAKYLLWFASASLGLLWFASGCFDLPWFHRFAFGSPTVCLGLL
jgi:hypothetical protein